MAAIDAGNPEAAGSALQPIRGSLADLRRRNGVTTFSDRVDAVSLAMEALAPFRKGTLDLNDAATLQELRGTDSKRTSNDLLTYIAH